MPKLGLLITLLSPKEAWMEVQGDQGYYAREGSNWKVDKE